MARFNFKDDRGSLITTLVFVTVGFMLASLMTGWMVTRIQLDHAATQDAQVRSATDSYSQAILESVNVKGPTSVKACAAGTTPTSACSKTYPDLKVRVAVTKWSAPAADGSITATLVGTSTAPNPVSAPVTTKLKLTLAGVGNYLGLDPETDRPLWTKPDAATGQQAVWDITPSGGESIPVLP